MAKANKKARAKADMDIILFGNVPHPTNKQIKNAIKNLKHIQRQNTRAININKFDRIHKRKHRKTSQQRSKEQIQRGFEISKKWKDEYDNNSKTVT